MTPKFANLMRFLMGITENMVQSTVSVQTWCFGYDLCMERQG